ncbi:nuclear transport factor 2 family protein [Rhodococcus triatomae]|uniref:Ketosteroid isomerase-related protein n=1 Tax=Rhodococcus triatomae TaxID=300028 RepID=A0A1G8B9U3_9NOCA|nr:nuclear transport factor 2 family protein [Rhodococcus triatomae]QNG17511.1 nuclear transport factor 2 family protein [Rhodococcus triatomae]QNG22821.1 nuclear transport factor 2 family protein [Rhodococcus triatomae]SDH29955.1 Ketosteroid isomerase-related protein [Rhodococcus triatomae]
MTTTDHPARVAGAASRAAASARDKAAWLALFAENACVEDPVGPSVFDPDGKGHHGLDAISRFYDMTIANTESLEFLVTDSLVCGNENVNIGTIRSTVAGSTIDAEGVFVYRVDEDGKIVSLRAFWEFERAMKTVRKA